MGITLGPHRNKPARFKRGRVVFLVLGTLLALVALVRWQAVLSVLGRWLIESQPPQRADLILVLGGDFWGPRVIKGADLATFGYAPIVLLSSPPYRNRPEGELAVPFLVQKGYRREYFDIFPHYAQSTIAEAVALRGELSRRRVKKVLLVTSSYHSRRAAIVFRLFCPGIQFISIPAPDANYRADGWWEHDTSREIFFSEAEKIAGTLVIAYPAYLLDRWRAELHEAAGRLDRRIVTGVEWFRFVSTKPATFAASLPGKPAPSPTAASS